MRKAVLFTLLLVSIGLAAWTWHRRKLESEWNAGYKQATSLYRDGKINDATLETRRLLTLAQARWPEGRQTGLTLNLYGLLQRALDKGTDAERTFEKAAAILKIDPGVESVDYARVLANLGNLYADSGRAEKADVAFQSSLNIYRSDPGAAMENRGAVALLLGQLRMRQGRYVDAAALFEEASLVDQKYLKPDDPEQLRVALALADSYRLVSRFSDAKAIYEKVVPFLEKSAPSDASKNPAIDAWPRYAFVLAEQGDFSNARVYASKTADAVRQIPASQGVDRASRLAGLADVYDRIHEFKEADTTARQATAALESLAQKDHPALPSTYFVLGRICLDEGNIPEAETYLRLALQGREKLVGPDHSATAIVQVSLAAVRLAQHRNSDARDIAQKALPILEKGQGAQSVDVARTLEIIAATEKADGNLPDAEAALKRAVDIRGQRQLPAQPAYLDSLRALEAVYLAEGKKDDSEAVQKRLQQARAASSGSVVEAKMKTN